nr:hypothetical protein [Glycomyces xiaoerkulensis]
MNSTTVRAGVRTARCFELVISPSAKATTRASAAEPTVTWTVTHSGSA